MQSPNYLELEEKIMINIPKGLCQCGCGQKTNINKRNDTCAKLIKGEFKRYCCGHGIKKKVGRIKRGAYIHILALDNPRADYFGYVPEQVVVIEKALKRFLTKEEIVHHINGNGRDNYIGNLMVFKNRQMHCAFHNRNRDLAKLYKSYYQAYEKEKEDETRS